MRRLEARAEDDDDDDADNDPNNRNDHPGQDRNDNDDDDDDGDDGNQRTWQHELSRLRRRRLLGSATGNNEEDLLDDDQNLVDTDNDTNANIDIHDDAINVDFDMDDGAINTDESRNEDLLGDGSQSPPRFVPHSRETSPDDDARIGSKNNDLDNNLDMDYDSIFGMRLDRIRTPKSPSVPDSPITPKLEPKPEPETEVITYTDYTRSRQTCDLIDLTGDDDDSLGSDNSVMEIIELTEDSDATTESTRTNSRYVAMIDLKQDTENSQNRSPMQIIELDD